MSAYEVWGILVSGTARKRLAELLRGMDQPAAASVYRKLFTTDLSVAVEGAWW